MAVCGIAYGLRKLAQKHVEDDFHQLLCMEAIAAFELCANALELSLGKANVGEAAHQIIYNLLRIYKTHFCFNAKLFWSF